MMRRILLVPLLILFAPRPGLAQGTAPSAPLGQLQVAGAMPSVTSAQAQAIGEELYDYLSQAAGGEARLFRLLTGMDRQINQTVSLLLDDSVVTPGNLVYQGAQINVVSKVTTLSACGPTQQSMQDSQSGSYVTQASWSAAKSQTSTRSRTIAVTASVSGFGASLSSAYSFTNSTSNTTSIQQGDSQSQINQWATEQTITAAPNTATVLRRDLLTLSAGPAGIQYTLKPVVAGHANLNFLVQTNGINQLQLAQQLFGAGGPTMAAFTNLPAPGQNFPSADAMFPNNGILLSADGRYAYGREIHGKRGDKHYGAYSLIDLGRTLNAAAPWRLWSVNCQIPSTLGHASPFVNFTLTTAGDAVWRCSNGAVPTHLRSGQATRACRYLSFVGDNGQLACFDRDVSTLTPGAASSYVAGYPGGKMREVVALPSQTQRNAVQYSVPLSVTQNALKLPSGDVALTLTGSFTGSHVVSQAWCATALPLVRNPRDGTCIFQHGMAPQDRAICPETSVELQRYNRSRPDAVTVISSDGSDVASQQ